MLGMLWHVDNKPRIEYETGGLWIGEFEFPSTKEWSKFITVWNLAVKKFRSLLRKRKNYLDDFLVYQIKWINNFIAHCEKNRFDKKDAELGSLKNGFRTLFRDNLPHGLPAERQVDHMTNPDLKPKPPHRATFQLSLAELLATKEYVTNLL